MRGWMAGLVALALPAGALAADWRPLDGPAITVALSARVLGYPDGTLQDVLADGRTLSGRSEGRWRVEGGRYCSNWPPAAGWSCYGVEAGARGLGIRIAAPDGSQTVGRYVDLN